jgi:hypothetical protein
VIKNSKGLVYAFRLWCFSFESTGQVLLNRRVAFERPAGVPKPSKVQYKLNNGPSACFLLEPRSSCAEVDLFMNCVQ